MKKIPQDMQAGTIHKSKSFGEFKILSYEGWGNVTIEFIDTGYSYSSSTVNIRRGETKDLMKPMINGVGFTGGTRYKASKNKKAYATWTNMMNRCYLSSRQDIQPTYKGCTVDKRWHNFQNFAEWYESNHPDDGEKYDLDKDIKIPGNKEYGPESCVFVSHRENSAMANAKNYTVKSPYGNIVNIYNMHKFCRENNLHPSCMLHMIAGRISNHNGWTMA